MLGKYIGILLFLKMVLELLSDTRATQENCSYQAIISCLSGIKKGIACLNTYLPYSPLILSSKWLKKKSSMEKDVLLITCNGVSEGHSKITSSNKEHCY